MLDSQVFLNASQARVDVRTATEWTRTAWDDLSVKTVKNCWNHAKILPAAVVATGPDDALLEELAALLLQVPEVELWLKMLWTMQRSDGQQHQSILKARTLNARRRRR